MPGQKAGVERAAGIDDGAIKRTCRRPAYRRVSEDLKVECAALRRREDGRNAVVDDENYRLI